MRKFKNTFKYSSKGDIAFAVLAVIIAFFCAYGWGSNILILLELAKANSSDVNYIMVILRIVGIPVFPLGCVLGYM